ncbi:hypothetical protein QAD02_005034 [Eretmocerus hayati]|uniref:Uncharacterized protein n=1 Tax=Eretmocerus hayati TaxID=131215 RepID=A0ACC2NRR3_9HYME|nr:hypothetical protein QAD02_005034 [Eretmocerus hayati]
MEWTRDINLYHQNPPNEYAYFQNPQIAPNQHSFHQPKPPHVLPYYDQEGRDLQFVQPNKQNFGPHNAVLQAMDPNVQYFARSASNCSSTFTDISYCRPGTSSNTINSDPNMRNFTAASSFNSTQTPGPRVRISDIPTNPLNGPVHQPRDVTSQFSQQKSNKSLESSYVYQISLRTWDGELELKKQEYIGKNMQEDEDKPIDVENDAVVNVGSDEDDCDSSEDDSDSEYDEYETEITDNLNTSLICSLVMQYEVDNHGYLPTKERLNWIVDQLCEVFTYQKRSAWIGTNKSGVIKGRFVNKLKELRRAATRWGLWKNPNNRPRRERKAPESYPDSLLYFKENPGFNDGSKKKWDETKTDRVEVFQKSNVATITTNFPLICTEEGFLLLRDDYQSDNPEENINIFKEKWPKLATVIIEYAKVLNVALVSLAHLLGSVTCSIVKGSKLSWKATHQEAQNSFIYHVKKISADEHEVNHAQQELKKLYVKHKADLNPYVIACGPLSGLSHCYVVLNDFKYKIQGEKCLLEAVDISYKSHRALYKRPPKAAKPAWHFVADKAYGHEIEHMAAGASRLITALTTFKIKPAKPKKRKRTRTNEQT